MLRTAECTSTVAGASTPLDLHVTRLPDPAPGTVRIRATGVLDRTGTPVRAPRWLIGRWIAVEAEATLRFRG